MEEEEGTEHVDSEMRGEVVVIEKEMKKKKYSHEEKEISEEFLGMPHSEESDDGEDEENGIGHNDRREMDCDVGNDKINEGDIQMNHRKRVNLKEFEDIFKPYSEKGICYLKEDLPILDQEIKLAN